MMTHGEQVMELFSFLTVVFASRVRSIPLEIVVAGQIRSPAPAEAHAMCNCELCGA